MADNILKAIITADGSQFEKTIDSVSGSMKSLTGDFKTIGGVIDSFAKSGKLSIGVLENSLIELKSVIKQTTNPEDLKKLNDAFTQLQGKLNALKIEGGLQSQLGGVSRSARLAHSDLEQLSQSIRGFASGSERGADVISNLVFTFERLQGVSGGIKGALAALGETLLGPAGIVLAATTLVPLIIELGEKFFGAGEEAREFEKKVDELKKSLDKLKEPINITIATASGSIAGEVTKLKTLVTQAITQQTVSGTETVESINRRKTALIELQKLYKDEFNNITFIADASNKLAIVQAGQAAENSLNRQKSADAVSKEVSEAQTLVNVTQARIDNLKKETDEKLKSLGITQAQFEAEEKRRAGLKTEGPAFPKNAPVSLFLDASQAIDKFKKQMAELVKIRNDAAKELGKKQTAEVDIVSKQVTQGDFKAPDTTKLKEGLNEAQRILIKFAEGAEKFFNIPVDLRISDLDTQAEKLKKALEIKEKIVSFEIKLKLPDTEKIDKIDIKNLPVEIQEFNFKGVDKFKTELQKAIENQVIEVRPNFQTDESDLNNVPGADQEKQLEDLTNEFAKFGDVGVRAWSKITDANKDNIARIRAGQKALEDLNTQQKIAIQGALAIGDAFSAAFGAIVNNKDPLTAFFDSLKKSVEQLIAKLIAAAVAAEILSVAGASIGGVSGFAGLFGKLLGFAEGGTPPTNRPSIVGEKGAELFFPGTSGFILSNQKSKALLSESLQQSTENKKAVYAHKFTTIINNIDNSVRKWFYTQQHTDTSTHANQLTDNFNNSYKADSTKNFFSELVTLLSNSNTTQNFGKLISSYKETSANSTLSTVDKLISSFSYRSSGGPVTRDKPFIVGEKRAELFIPDQSGAIVPTVLTESINHANENKNAVYAHKTINSVQLSSIVASAISNAFLEGSSTTEKYNVSSSSKNSERKTDNSEHTTVLKSVSEIILSAFNKLISSDKSKLDNYEIFKSVASRDRYFLTDSVERSKDNKQSVYRLKENSNSQKQSSSVANFFERLVTLFNSTTENFSEFVNATTTKILDKSSSTNQTSTNNFEKLVSSFSYRSTGGEVTHRKPFIVGEHRPELFVPKEDGFIVPFVPTRTFDDKLIQTLNVNKSIGFRAGGGPVSAGSQFAVGEFGAEAFFPNISNNNPQSGGGIVHAQQPIVMIPEAVIRGNDIALVFNRVQRSFIATTGKKPF